MTTVTYQPTVPMRHGHPTNGNGKMRDFSSLKEPFSEGKVDKQAGVSTIHGGTETGESARGVTASVSASPCSCCPAQMAGAKGRPSNSHRLLVQTQLFPLCHELPHSLFSFVVAL